MVVIIGNNMDMIGIVRGLLGMLVIGIIIGTIILLIAQFNLKNMLASIGIIIMVMAMFLVIIINYKG